MFNPLELSNQQYAILILKFSCTVKVSEEYFVDSMIIKDRRIDCKKDYTITCYHPRIVENDANEPTRDVWITLGSCGLINEERGPETEEIEIDAKYLRMVSRRHIPRNFPIVHQEENAWANKFPTCVCGELEDEDE